jgi:[glutamine synthetase] adenylyltransferase / [glutamine synthetase]-adenylyl-L-tyrosine phosphorylase
MSSDGQSLLEKIRLYSPYLSQVLQQQPSLAEEIFLREGYLTRPSSHQLAQKLRKELNGREDFQAFGLSLRRFKQAEILRVAARDLGGRISLKECTQELTNLAQVCLESATAYCYRELVKEKNWNPILLEQKGLVVLGLGKFGGEELNFSSDIDLIFLYQPLADLPFSFGEQREFYQLLTRRITQSLAALMNGDLVFRVDLNLRPGGKDSELALRLDSAIEYYQSEAKTWERMALIKARTAAGNPDLGRRFLEAIQPVVYRRFMDYSVLEEIRGLKERILQEARTHLLAEDNIKLGPGGIREIEFIVQALQLVFGGRVPTIREKNTLTALRRLHQAHLLPKEEYRRLVLAYTFLRTLEHRLQMRHQRQTHSLPKDDGLLTQVARSMPPRKSPEPLSLEDWLGELARIREGVQQTFAQLLLAPVPASPREVSRLLEPEEPDDWKTSLQALGFQQWGPAREILGHWKKRLASSQRARREKELLIRIVPALLHGVIQTPDPDQTLHFLDLFLRSLGGRTGILSMLLERTALLTEILHLFARSTLLARFFIQNPGLVDRLALRWESGFSFFTDWPSPLPDNRPVRPDLEETLSRLRQWKNEHFLEIALEEMAGRLNAPEASERLSRLADQVIVETARVAEDTLSREVMHPFCPRSSKARPPAPFCILGLGKLGGQEMGYASDLDLMFVYSLKTAFPEETQPAPRTARSKESRPWITWNEYLVRLAQRLISYISLPLKEGPGYGVDARLRPSGTFGPLVVSLDSFRDYYRHRAQNWELQMLLKARLIAGPDLLAQQIRDEIHQLLYQTPPPAGIREEMAYFRNRMEVERSGEGKGRVNPKLGYGGLTDIEFIAQYLQRLHGLQVPEVRRSNTLQVLRALRDAGVLPEEAYRILRDGHQFLCSLDHGLQLFLDRREEPRTYLPLEIKRLEKLDLMGLGQAPPAPILSWDLFGHYQKVTRTVRGHFQKIFNPHHKKSRSPVSGGLL